MDIRINDKKISKDAFLQLIANNKLQAIIFIRNIVNIGLKDAQEIVENLEGDPNYYDNAVVRIDEKEFVVGESITLDIDNTPAEKIDDNKQSKIDPFITKHKTTHRKWMYLLGLIFIIFLLYFLVK